MQVKRRPRPALVEDMLSDAREPCTFVGHNYSQICPSPSLRCSCWPLGVMQSQRLHPNPHTGYLEEPTPTAGYGWGRRWSRAKDSRVFGQGTHKDVALWAIYRPSIGQEARAGAINQIRTKNEREHVPQEKGHRSQTMSTSHCQCKGAVNEHWPSPPSLKK